MSLQLQQVRNTNILQQRTTDANHRVLYAFLSGKDSMPAMAATHSHVGMNPNRIRPTEDIFNPDDPHIREASLRETCHEFSLLCHDELWGL